MQVCDGLLKELWLDREKDFRAMWRLFLLPGALAASQVRLKRCASCACSDLELVDLDGGENASVPEIHAVKYWPEPVGYAEVFKDRSRDPYNHNYQETEM